MSAAASSTEPRVHLLNRLVGLPTTFDLSGREAGPGSSLYLFDYNYIDPPRTRDCVPALQEALSSAHVDLASKTLLLAAKGLDPANETLLDFGRRFGELHLFFEGWNMIGELTWLAAGEFAHLYFHPVTSKVRERPRAPGPRAGRNVLVSLGGDDDLDLVRAVIAACPELRFHVPDLAWDKSGPDKRFFRVRIDAPNVARVRCSVLKIKHAYRAAFAACDIVLIANVAEKQQQMRGGVRVADAFHARKHLVMTENPMCQLTMAFDERTCLVARHDASHVAAQLRRIASGCFHVDPDVYEPISKLTRDDNKLAWMLAAASDPVRFGRSVFAWSPARLNEEIRTLLGIAELDSVFGIIVRDKLVADGSDAFCVTRIASENLGAFLIELVPETGGRPVSIAIHTQAVEQFAMRTKRGNYLVARSCDLTEPARKLLPLIADRT